MARIHVPIVLVLLSAGLFAQPLVPQFDASDPGNPDNELLYVIQPSRHGTVFVLPMLTGNTGYQAVPVLSLNGLYEAGNTSVTDTFCDLDPIDQLLFPNPNSVIPVWLSMVGPLAQGVWTPFSPPVLVSGPGNAEVAVYFQLCQALDVGNGFYDIDFSNGLTLVQTEGQGEQLTGAPVVHASKLGEALAVGDFNGDGVDDLAVGAPSDMAQGHLRAGRVYIYVGLQRTPGFLGGLHPMPYVLEEPNMSQLLPSENPGPETHARFGGALAAGDVDGDGVDELVVGVPDGNGVSNEARQGEAYLYRSLEGHLSTTPVPTSPVLMNVPAGTVTQIRPVIEKADAAFGLRIAVGDITGDQIDDIVVSAPFFDVSSILEQEVGAAYIFEGPLLAGVNFVNEDAVLQDAVIGENERFGAALATADLDQDLTDEILIGVPGQNDLGAVGAGKVCVFSYGPAGVSLDSEILHPAPVSLADFGGSISVGDINGDGMPDVVSGADEDVTMNGANGPGVATTAGVVYVMRGPNYNGGHEVLTTPSGPESYGQFGHHILVTDLNADGIDDLVASTPGSEADGLPFAGQVFTYFGSTMPGLDDDYRILALKSDQPQALSLFGMTLAAGDFAGVGVHDLVCAEPVAISSGGGVGTGRVVIYTDLLHRKDNVTRSQLFGGVIPNP